MIILRIVFMTLAACLFVACNQISENEPYGFYHHEYGIQYLVGYIYISENTLYLDRVRVFISDGIGRQVLNFLEVDDYQYQDLHLLNLECWIHFSELGLMMDTASGHFTEVLQHETLPFDITDTTLFTFFDFELRFGAEPNSDRIVTTELEEFLLHLTNLDLFPDGSRNMNMPLDSQESTSNRIPYFLRIYQDMVLTVHEVFLLTM